MGSGMSWDSFKKCGSEYITDFSLFLFVKVALMGLTSRERRETEDLMVYLAKKDCQDCQDFQDLKVSKNLLNFPRIV